MQHHRSWFVPKPGPVTVPNWHPGCPTGIYGPYEPGRMTCFLPVQANTQHTHRNNTYSLKTIKPGRSPHPATVGRGVFLNRARRSTSHAGGASIPCPPAAASAAGGWGIGVPRPVHSVGISGWPAGGAEEEVVRSARRFVEELTLSGGGALWSSAVEFPHSPSSRIPGSVEFVSPSPALAWRSGRIVKEKKKGVIRSLAMELTACGVGSLEPATGDFPSVQGMHPNQVFEGCRCGGAPPAASRSSSTSGSTGLVG